MREVSGRSLIWIAVALAFALVFPWVLRDGMFCDGVLYATVSKNLAEGLGTFWHPQFSCDPNFSFHEQPPLVFYLQSWFFKIFPSIYPERLWCLLMLFISGFLILQCWKVFYKEKKFSAAAATSLFFFVISPVTIWSYTNNVIEITMVNFVLAAAYFQFSYFRQNQNRIFLFIAGIFIVLASLCKGVQGTFLISLPFLFWMVYRKSTFLKMIIDSIILISPVILFYGIALMNDSVLRAYELYFSSRFDATFAGAHDTVPSRIYLLWDLFQIALPPIVICFLVLFFVRHKKSYGRDAAFFALIAASGILPLMVTKEQRTFYMLTGFPFLMMSLAAVLGDRVHYLHSRISFRTRRMLKFVSMFICVVAIAYGLFFTAGNPGRDEALLADVHIVGSLIGKGNTVAVSESLYNEWSVPSYFNRYYHICLVTGNQSAGKNWYLVRKGESMPAGYKVKDLRTEYFVVGMRE